jgi:fatty-acyl-CoA synthase
VSGRWRFLPPGQRGSLAVSGPTVFPGYVAGRNADGPVLDPAGKVTDGWLDTGDLGSVSDDGFVTLTGRAKDIIIRGGHNIDPAEVEEVLRRHPAVVDAGVVGRPDQHSGEVPVAFVVVGDRCADADEIRRWAADRVPERAAAPKAVTVLPALPLTAVGKPYKLGLRILATRHELAARLAAIGYRVPDDGWCDQHDGQIAVALPPPPDATLRAAVCDLLDRYPLTWRFR